MMKFAQWYVDHYCDILGWVAVVVGMLSYKQQIEAVIIGTGGIILWGLQAVIEEMRKERTIKFEPINTEKEDV